MQYGFQTGDLICITGELGLAALGFELLRLKDMLKINLFEMVDLEEKISKAYEIDSTLCDLAIFKASSYCFNFVNISISSHNNFGFCFELML